MIPVFIRCAMLVVLFAFPVARPDPVHANGGAPSAEVVLLMGQSNMVGHDRTAPAMSTAPRVLFWTGHLGGAWWWQASEPLMGDGYGPGTDFGKHLLAIRPDIGSVLLIPCAVGGTTADRWAPGGDLYERCLGYAQASGLRPTGALVYQGESDATTQGGADAWAGRFSKQVAGLRAEYGEIPVVYAQITHAPAPLYADMFPYWSQVRTAEAGVNLAGVAMVRTDDLWAMPDGIHLTWYSELALGQRMARAYARLLG